jgi:hypothetical protein
MRKILSITAIVTAAAMIATAALAAKWPWWQRRIARDVEERHKLSYQSITKDVWPAEPKSPSPVDRERFRRAIGTICPTMPDERLDNYHSGILERSSQFEIDPFLLGALVYDRSGCLPKTPEKATGYGLTRIDIDMHAPHIRGGRYKYFVLENGGWTEKHLDVSELPFNRWKAAKAASNFFWSSAILRVWKEQCVSLDEAFQGTPHRHYISHWFYGDKVRGIEPEDRVLTARRRLLSYYDGDVPKAVGEFHGVKLFSPLDGEPRLVIDYFGNNRGGKSAHGHQGIDLSGHVGEPVRAVGSGRVVFAGVDVPGQGSKQLTPSQAADLSNIKSGAGGLYVVVNHGDGFRSYYMHLNAISVKDWDEVEAGEVIGALGKTGTSVAGPHLHLEFRVGTERVDPAPHTNKVTVNPFVCAE